MAIAEDAELHLAALALDHVRPGQRDELGDAEASAIANLDEDAIAPRGSGAHQQANLDLADNALRDAARLGMRLDDGAGVELQIPAKLGKTLFPGRGRLWVGAQKLEAAMPVPFDPT